MKTIVQPADRAWNDFLEEEPDSNIFQSPTMADVYRKAKNHRPIALAWEDNGQVRAILASVVVSYSSSPKLALTSRAIAVGGPLGDSTAFASLLAAHDSRVQRAALLTQIRNLRQPVDRTPFESAGYRWESHLNYVIDLTKGEDATFEGISRTKRKGIARAERSGLALVELGIGDVERFYALLKATYSRARVPLADSSLFHRAFETLIPEGQLLAVGASQGGNLCAVRLVMQWKSKLYDWYAGSSDEGRESRANEWLVWQVLRKGIENGCSEFDFGGAGRPKEAYGPGNFKREFGGHEIDPGRFEKVYRPITLKAAKALYSAWRRIG